MKLKEEIWKKVVPLIVLTILVLAVVITLVLSFNQKSENKAEVVTISTLEKIINVSKLSTFTSVYNGIAQVNNENSPEKIDYYVSYEARVNAGIDFDQVSITIDDESTIHIHLPPVHITDIEVDIGSLDYIFLDNSKNASTVSQQAYLACEADVKEESENQDAILDFAEQNAKNILTALTRPVIEQLDESYTLVVD